MIPINNGYKLDTNNKSLGNIIKWCKESKEKIVPKCEELIVRDYAFMIANILDLSNFLSKECYLKYLLKRYHIDEESLMLLSPYEMFKELAKFSENSLDPLTSKYDYKVELCFYESKDNILLQCFVNNPFFKRGLMPYYINGVEDYNYLKTGLIPGVTPYFLNEDVQDINSRKEEWESVLSNDNTPARESLCYTLYNYNDLDFLYYLEEDKISEVIESLYTERLDTCVNRLILRGEEKEIAIKKVKSLIPKTYSKFSYSLPIYNQGDKYIVKI